MIVDYKPSEGLSLVDAHDFKGFKLRLGGPVVRPEIDGVVFVDDDNVLIAIETAPSLPGG